MRGGVVTASAPDESAVDDAASAADVDERVTAGNDAARDEAAATDTQEQFLDEDDDSPLSFFENQRLNKCNEMLDHTLDRSLTAKFMVRAMHSLGCVTGDTYITCEPRCTSHVSGGYLMDENDVSSIIVCANKVSNQGMVDRVVTHELLHAYDACRADVDWTNCEHHACSEIRAANLSGDCHLLREWRRGHIRVHNAMTSCVKRRAKLSVSMNPACGDKWANYAVEKVFDRCYGDLSPFQAVP